MHLCVRSEMLADLLTSKLVGTAQHNLRMLWQRMGISTAAKADERYARNLKEYLDVIRHHAKATDSDALQEKHLGLFQTRVFLDHLLTDQQALLLAAVKQRLLQLVFEATANAMSILVKEAGDQALLDLTTPAANVVIALCADASSILSKISILSIQVAGIGENPPFAKIDTGFIAALTEFTECAVNTLEHRAAVVRDAANSSHKPQPPPPQQSHQQQQRQEDNKPHVELLRGYLPATQLYQSLLHLWMMLSTRNTEVLQQAANVTRAMAAAAHLTAVAAPLLQKVQTQAIDTLHGRSKGRVSDTRSSMIMTSAAEFSRDFYNITHHSIMLSIGLVIFIMLSKGDPIDSQQQQPQQQQQQGFDLEQILDTEHLGTVLLQMLVGQAAGLSVQSAQQAKAAARMAARQQHSGLAAGNQTPASISSQQQRVLQSHVNCLNSLGLCSTWPQQQGGSNEQCSYSDLCCSSGLDIFKQMLIRHTERRALRTTAAESQQERQQQQQVDIQMHDLPFPTQQLQIIIKLLIEMVLLLPSELIHLQVNCLELMLLLLHTSAPASEVMIGAVGSAAALPAAVAAGLLQPVVQVLSRDVVKTLKKTEPQQWQRQQQRQQQRPQQQQKDDTSANKPGELAHQRQLLLKNFGDSLIAVCQAVEPKHIAAALKSDPVIPLVAIEAVIRAHACRLGVADSSFTVQPLQQQERISLHTAEGEQLYMCLGTICSLPEKQPRTVVTRYPWDQVAVLLLLPFVASITQAVHELISNKQQSQFTKELLDYQAGDTVSDLAIRLFSVLETSLKVVKLASSILDSGVSHMAAADGAGIDQLAEAVTLGTAHSSTTAASVQQDATIRALCLSSGYLMVIPRAVMDIATEWETILQGRLDSIGAQQASMPLSLLMQAVNALVAAMAPGSCILASRIRQQCCKASTPEDQQGRSPPAATAAGSSRLISESDDVVARVANGVLVGIMQEVEAVMQRICQLYRFLIDTTEWKMANFVTDRSSQQQRELQHMRAEHNTSLMLDVSFLKLLENTLHFPNPKITTDKVYEAVRLSYKLAETLGDVSLDSRPGPSKEDSVSSTGCTQARSWSQQLVHQLKLDIIDEHSRVMHAGAVKAGAVFPMAFCCNNPTCVNLAKLSEYQLVSGKACVCGGCKVARYCSRECQKHHKKQHKPVCDRMQQSSDATE